MAVTAPCSAPRSRVLLPLAAASAFSFVADGGPPVQAASQALFECRPSASIEVPDMEPPGAGSSEPLEAPCPDGQVPQPTARFANKGRPGLSLVHINNTSYYYYYTAAFQTISSSGLLGSLTQHKPTLSKRDYHSLAEIAAISSDGKQMVEVGWTVDPSVNGDSEPHLFVFHWVDLVPGCYNGCGWVQVSSTRYPGMKVSVTSSPQSYVIANVYGNWWVGYQGEWIGYFPGTLWGDKFKSLGLAQWFGEVSTARPFTCGDMGSGAHGDDDDNDDSARFSSLKLVYSDGSTKSATASPLETRESFYSLGDFSGSSFHYGGPGGC